MTTLTQPVEPRPALIGGRTVDAGDVCPVVFPYTGEAFASVRLVGEDAIEEALSLATECRGAVAAVPPAERAAVLLRAAEIVEGRLEELARQITLETGNAIWETRLEVRRTTEILRAAAEETRRLVGEIVPIDGWPNGVGRRAMTQRVPVGPVLAITPYNAPLLLVAHKLASAFGAGNPCIVRPATKTPLSALSLGEIFTEAGATRGSVTVVPCPSRLGEAMARDERIKMVSFTGSEEVGWHLRRVAATHRVTLELGGNGAVIIHSDANLAYAAKRCAFGGFLRAGQACISVQRIFVAADVADAFEARFLDEIGKMTLGNPLDDDTVIGVLVDDAAADNALTLIEDARNGGATMLCGGGRDGRIVEPTVLRGIPRGTLVADVEAFAPVVSIEPYTDFDAALDAANATRYGLQAGLFTNDMRLVFRAFDRLEVGGLIVNDANTFRVDHMPYGGTKQSGIGREGVHYAMREMTEERLLVLDPTTRPEEG
ncbi:MAG: aldehyde dehydrogenase family protein [Gaiellales bacterium]